MMMKYIYDSKTLVKEQELINKFGPLFENGFRDVNEKESFEVIQNRVKGDKQALEPHSIIILSTDDIESEVTGGLIADWYENSKCIHLIYLIIDEKHRRKGIAGQLINEGVIRMKNWIKKERGIEIKNVVFESNIPWKTKEENENFNMVDRLKIFSKLGAKWIDIPYVQPALDSSKEKVDNLFLLSFPQFNAKGNSIPANELIDFLSDLYKGLDVKDPEQNDDFKNMQTEIDHTKDNYGDIILDQIPYEEEWISYSLENPSYKFDKTSITIHFIEKDADTKNELVNRSYFSSFERDLLNFQNQKFQPLKSILIHPKLEAKLILPKIYKYTSEGTTHKITSQRTDLNVVVSLSYTHVHLSNNMVWHLTIKPADEESFFTEYDIIKLATLFGSTQEDSTVKERIKFNTDGNNSNNLSLLEFVKQISQKDTELKILGNGIIQIDIDNLEQLDKNSSAEFFEIFQKQERHLLGEGNIKSFAQVICGIILGIFDFERMDTEEIDDTIQPFLASDSSFLVICRGNFLKISKSDELMDLVSDTIIVNPYLLIPSAVLSHNEFILSEAKTMLDEALGRISKLKLHELEAIQTELNNIINYQHLIDIFQYRSEQTIIEKGNQQRGLVNIHNNITIRLDELFKVIKIKQENRSNLSDAFLNAFLGLIAMVQLNSIFTALIPFKHNDLIFYSIEVMLAIIIFRLVRAKKG